MRCGLSPLHSHWYYVWIPIVTAFVWVGTLFAMLITWLAQGRPKYVSMEGKIAYISDIGADILKPLFITGCCITGVGFVLTLVVERWLRHRGRYGFEITGGRPVLTFARIQASARHAQAGENLFNTCHSQLCGGRLRPNPALDFRHKTLYDPSSTLSFDFYARSLAHRDFLCSRGTSSPKRRFLSR
jgi:hypothetical protein